MDDAVPWTWGQKNEPLLIKINSVTCLFFNKCFVWRIWLKICFHYELTSEREVGGWGLPLTRGSSWYLSKEPDIHWRTKLVLAHLGNLELFTGSAEFQNEKTRSEQLVFKKMLPELYRWHRAKGSNSDTSWLQWVQKGGLLTSELRPLSLDKTSLQKEIYITGRRTWARKDALFLEHLWIIGKATLEHCCWFTSSQRCLSLSILPPKSLPCHMLALVGLELKDQIDRHIAELKRWKFNN